MWDTVYGVDFSAIYDRKWVGWTDRTWPAILAMVKERNPEARTWLDLCCGTGRLLKRASLAGYEVTGVDRSPHQLRHARRNAPDVRLVRADIRRYTLGRRFDVVTCMFDSINYLIGRSDWIRALRNARNHLGPDGIFIFDVNTPYGHRRHWCSTGVVRDSSSFTTMETSYDPGKGLARARISGFRKMRRQWHQFDEMHVQRSWPDSTLGAMIRTAGMTFRRYGSPPFKPPSPSSSRIFYVCRLG
ncbi:MAG: class I SAM-dependent methyltransferase [Candidatus Coatesbacteria bacterium]